MTPKAVPGAALFLFTTNLIGGGLRPVRGPHSGTATHMNPTPAADLAPLLAVSGLHVTFPGGVRAVRGAGFSVAPGEVLAIVGESGAGKSATALAVMGLLPAAAQVEGSVRLRGRELLGLGDRALAAIRGHDLAMLCQDQEFTPVYRIGTQIAEAIRLHCRVSRRAAAERAIELLRLAEIPDAARVARAFPHELSGGLRRRAMIAMAVAGDPAVILADEPTAGLDPPVQAKVLDTLQAHQSRTGAALVLITHDLGVVAGRADRVMVVYAGRPVETGPVDEIFYRPRMPYTIALLNSVARLDHPRVRPSPIWADPSSEVGGLPSEGPTRTPRAKAVVLEVAGLVRHYPLVKGVFLRRRTGIVRAVDGIGFDIRVGETLGLVGESGCGKTTALMAILRLGATQAGRLAVFGRDTATLSASERRALRRDVQIVFQDPLAALDPRMTVEAILAEPLRAHRRRDVGTRVPELLRLTGLEHAHASRYPGELSGGQRQRVGIARALALEPKLLLMDEPFSALDVSVQAGIIALLRELKTRLGLSYLLAAHDLAAVRQLADRVAVMRLGRIVEIGDADAIYETPAHPYTQALLAAVPLTDPRRERARRRIPVPDDPPERSERAGRRMPVRGNLSVDRPESAGCRVSVPGELPTGLSGCRFRALCPAFATLAAHERQCCTDEEPDLRPLGPDRAVACHFAVRSPR